MVWDGTLSPTYARAVANQVPGSPPGGTALELMTMESPMDIAAEIRAARIQLNPSGDEIRSVHRRRNPGTRPFDDRPLEEMPGAGDGADTDPPPVSIALPGAPRDTLRPLTLLVEAIESTELLFDMPE